jgi:Holliday junction resolvase RusA-like endonuclease
MPADLTEFTFTIPGQAVPMPRYKIRSWIKGLIKRKYAPRCPECDKQLDIGVQHYIPDDHKVHAWKQSVLASFLMRPDRPAKISGPVHMQILVIRPRPLRLRRKRDPDGRMWHAGKSDTDNVAKAIMDALSGHAYHDDAQVCSQPTFVQVAAKDEEPHTIVSIAQLPLAVLESEWSQPSLGFDPPTPRSSSCPTSPGLPF